MKNLIITGATGLVGSFLLPEILKGDYKVYVISQSTKALPDAVTRIPIDLSEDWDETLLPDQADIIIHLAQSENFRDFPGKAKDVFYVNTLSTLKLADYAYKSGVKSFIYASSAGIYGSGIETGFNEEMPIVFKPELGFYLGTKHCSEVILDNYSNQFNVVMLRFFFVYGKGQRESMLIPRLVNNVRYGNEITIQGDQGLFINPTHGIDAAAAIIKAIELKGSHKVNVGGPEVISLRQIAEVIGDALGKAPVFKFEPSDPKYLTGDISKMKEVLVSPKIKFSQGVQDFL